MAMSGRKHPLQVRFSVEARVATPAQTEAGERLFGKLTMRACSSLTAAMSAPNEVSEHSDEQGDGGRRQPSAFSDPPHSLTGGSQRPLSDWHGS